MPEHWVFQSWIASRSLLSGAPRATRWLATTVLDVAAIFSFSPCGRRWRGRSPCRMRGLHPRRGSLTRLEFASLIRATLSRKGRVKKVRAYPALAAFLRYARCTAQLHPGGWAAISFEATSLAGTADIGASVGIASLTRRSCAD